MPDYVKLQHGGGIGFVSLGAGYVSRDEKLELDFMYGYVPQKLGGVEIHSATVKLNWIPVPAIETKSLVFRPLVAGLLANYSFGKQYFSLDPPNYSYSYYNFPTALNAAIFLAGGLGVKLSGAEKAKRLSFYYEVLIFDRELISYIGNPRALSFDDILTLGLGLKFSFN